MELIFLCVQGGRRFYTVRLNGSDLFTGTSDECARFIELHNRKVEEEKAQSRRTPRNRPAAVRTYRALKVHA